MMYIKKGAIRILSGFRFLKLYLTYKIVYLLLINNSKKQDLEIFTGKKVVIITAHPDDEIFSLAHFVAAFSNYAKEIYWVNTTLGQNSISSSLFISNENTAAVRATELVNAANILDIDKVYHLRIPSYLSNEIGLANYKHIEQLVIDCDYLFLIGYNDSHPDHAFTTKTFEKIKGRQKIFYYNVQRLKYITNKKYYFTEFDKELYLKLLDNYKSQEHMKKSFEAYCKAFHQRKVFIYQ